LHTTEALRINLRQWPAELIAGYRIAVRVSY
jgi:hypothetical protein